MNTNYSQEYAIKGFNQWLRFEDLMTDIIYEKLSFQVISAVFEVHNVLGSGFLEKVYGKIIIELKSVDKLVRLHEAQLLNYLKVTGIKLGYLINMASKSVDYKRLVY